MEQTNCVQVPFESGNKAEKSKIIVLEELKLNLEIALSEVKKQLDAQNSRCQVLEEQVAAHVVEKVELEKKIVELDCNCKNLNKEVEKLGNDKEALSEEKCDLEITVAENDVYGQALQEHVDELENICATLRDQRDAQHNYFLQRELTLKAEMNEQMEQVKDQNSALTKDFAVLKTEHLLLKDDLAYLQALQELWEKEKERLRQEIEDLKESRRSLENSLTLEKETVSMLSDKNTSLNEEMLNYRNQTVSSTPTGKLSSAQLSKETTNEIEELVRKFYEQKLTVANQFNEARLDELLKQVTECEQKLAVERRMRQDSEIKLETMEAELQKTKRDAEAIMSLSMKRRRNGLNHSQMFSTTPLSLLNATGDSCLPLKPTNFALLPTFDSNIFESSDISSGHVVPKATEKCSESIKLANEKAMAELRKLSIIK